MALSMMWMSLALADPSASRAATNLEQQYDRWERRLRAKLAELHVVPASAKGDPACDVVIRFAVGQNGRPSDPTVRTSSCKPFYDRAAYRLVRSLGRVGRVPSAAGKDHHITLKLTYGKAPSVTADRSLTESLKVERNAHSRRNVELVSMAANQNATRRPGQER